MRSLTLVSIKGSPSLANPGSMPLTNREAPPLGRRLTGVASSVDHPVGILQEHRPRGHHVHPGPQDGAQVVQRFHHTVVGHGGVDDAVRPQGHERLDVVGGRHPERAIEAGQLAGSLPALSRLDTHTPTSSRSGRASIPAMAWRPTLPVLQATTRYVLS